MDSSVSETAWLDVRGARMRGTPTPVFSEVFILKGFKCCVLEVFILNSLWADFMEVRIIKDLVICDW